MSQLHTLYDVAIVGGGHNGLVAATYLAKAGKKVLLLEKNDYIGGATVSARVFPEFDARLSRYAYLVSLFPQKILQDLNIDIEFRRRRIASFTPFSTQNSASGLLLSNVDNYANDIQIEQLAVGDVGGYSNLLRKQQLFAQKIWESFLHPLGSKASWEKQFSTAEEREIWNWIVEKPIGEFIENHVKSDILRGVVLTDAKIGAYTHAHDERLLQNQTYLYHIVGNETGEWRVPVGGMGALVEAIRSSAIKSGAQLVTKATAKSLNIGNEYHTIGVEVEEKNIDIKAKYVLINAAPISFAKLVGETYRATEENEGTAFKVNMLLQRLPKLKSGVAPTDAFAGTFHINQSYTQLEEAYRQAKSGKVPTLPPCEIYCHTLTDSSILSPSLADQGYHTLTLFGLDAAYSLFKDNPSAIKKQFLEGYLESINSYLEEPIEACLAKKSDGSLCIEAKSAWDLEQEIGLPQGNIFHKSLSWFFAEHTREEGKWGVETPYPRVYICGSSAKRGGAVSGIAGHNAAMCVLDAP